MPDALDLPDDPRITVLPYQNPLHNCYPKWNYMARRAKGEFFAFLPADDVWLPHKLETQLAAIGDHGECVSRATHVDANLKPFESRRVRQCEEVRGMPQAAWDARFARGNLIYNCTVLYRASLHGAIGYFDQSMINLADLDWHIRVNRHSGIAVVEESLVLSHNTDVDPPHLRESYNREIAIIKQRYYQ